ncbi:MULTISPECIES: hypothetical protein [Martelella]|uniref:hypothetical protein n=1 Tax=Martelella TaxID=293088 RepID=UPI00158FFA06|nr:MULTISPECIES: hypothetical protein [Martelella]
MQDTTKLATDQNKLAAIRGWVRLALWDAEEINDEALVYILKMALEQINKKSDPASLH